MWLSNWTGSAWTRVLHEKFLYDGWNLLGAFNGTNAAIVRSLLWGLDLSGSMQGAGGVGGLIAFRQHSGSLAGSHFAAYDGNGNVKALVDGKTGSTSARYEYDPFGQTIRASGTMATVNPVRFSSKVVDDETDYAYYGYRYLNPNSGRWLSRDPIREKGGNNLYGFAKNEVLSRSDALGLVDVINHPIEIIDVPNWNASATLPRVTIGFLCESSGFMWKLSKFTVTTMIFIGIPSRDSSYWTSNPGFVDPDLELGWNDAPPTYDGRVGYVLDHENLHVIDIQSAFRDVEDSLKTHEGSIHCTQGECNDFARSVQSEALTFIQDAARDSQERWD